MRGAGVTGAGGVFLGVRSGLGGWLYGEAGIIAQAVIRLNAQAGVIAQAVILLVVKAEVIAWAISRQSVKAAIAA